VRQYQKGKTNLDFTGARESEWQWHQLGHMQVCTSLQTDNHASTPPLSFFTDRMPFLPSNQQCQSTEGNSTEGNTVFILRFKNSVPQYCVFMVLSSWLTVIARVHPLHLINAYSAPDGCQPSDQAKQLGL